MNKIVFPREYWVCQGASHLSQCATILLSEQLLAGCFIIIFLIVLLTFLNFSREFDIWLGNASGSDEENFTP